MAEDYEIGTMSKIADEVVDQLNDNDFKACFDAYKQIVPDVELKDMGDTLFVIVAPVTFDTAIISRGRDLEEDHQVNIGVLQVIPDLTNKTLDPLIALVERIAKFFPGVVLSSTGSTCMSTQALAAYDPERMKSERVFQGVISLSFKLCS